VPLNKVWFLTYFCLYLFLYTSYRLYTYPFITSLVHSLQFIVHRIFIYFHINPFTHLPIHTSTHSLIYTHSTITANILPQEGMAQGFYLYGGGGILPVAIVFIIFLTLSLDGALLLLLLSLLPLLQLLFYGWHRGTTSTGEGVYVPPVEDTAGGTGVYLYGGRGMSPLPPICDW
jgi:hypothetical protein